MRLSGRIEALAFHVTRRATDARVGSGSAWDRDRVAFLALVPEHLRDALVARLNEPYGAAGRPMPARVVHRGRDTVPRSLPASPRAGTVEWPGKTVTTFSDALASVRRWLWGEALLPQAREGTALEKLPEQVRELVLATLAPAA